MTYTKISSDAFKSVLILVILWYGLIVFHTPKKMMGWPCLEEPPEMAVILSWKVIDPIMNPQDAGIYLWMVPKRNFEEEPKSLLWSLLPQDMFCPESESIPRAYKFPYSEEEHKSLGKANKMMEKGNLLIFKRGKKGDKGRTGGEDKDPDTHQYEILKFDEIFNKNQEGQ